jgi:nucleotide-binding universal stress UspA family protein
VRNILIATDGSESADEALDLAIEIARNAGATLRVLSVRPPKRSTHDDGRSRAVEEIGGCQRIADAAAVRARQAGVQATSDVAHGDVVTSIADAAGTLGVDLLVVGSRRHSPSERPGALGSVAQAMVRNSPVPVTVVRQARQHPRSPAPDRSTATPEPTVRPWSMFD